MHGKSCVDLGYLPRSEMVLIIVSAGSQQSREAGNIVEKHPSPLASIDAMNLISLQDILLFID